MAYVLDFGAQVLLVPSADSSAAAAGAGSACEPGPGPAAAAVAARLASPPLFRCTYSQPLFDSEVTIPNGEG